jgi:hypothetical protein
MNFLSELYLASYPTKRFVKDSFKGSKKNLLSKLDKNFINSKIFFILNLNKNSKINLKIISSANKINNFQHLA